MMISLNQAEIKTVQKLRKFVRTLPEPIKARLRSLLSKSKVHFTSRKQKFELFKPVRNLDTNITFNKIKKPLVSIIIPVHNKFEYTSSCLRAVLANTKNIPYEIIIADDASTDETQNLLKYAKNIRVIRNKKNVGFLKNCNNAAKHARGDYLLFLNNDTNVQKDWLKYLLLLFENDKKTGLVGPKLIYPNGLLQEAGGIVWKDGSAWNFGKYDDPTKPAYNYVKEVDYISGACILTQKKLWDDIGGFDEIYSPAYLEDTDLAFAVRKNGYKVLYQPKSVVVHFEGISHGTNEKEGIKRYQNINRIKFVQKWHKILQKEYFSNGEHIFLARDRSKNKKTIVVIDRHVPTYDRDAGSRAIYHYLRLFVEAELRVVFISDNFPLLEPYVSELEQLGIEVFYSQQRGDNWEKWIKTHSHYIHYFFLSRPGVAIKYIDFIKKNTKAKVIYFGHDLHYLRYFRQYRLLRAKKLLHTSMYWKKIECSLLEKADVIYYPSLIEIQKIKELYPQSNAKVFPLYVFDIFHTYHKSSLFKRKDLLFVGGFDHDPNVDAMLWFINDIFPVLLLSNPGMKLYVVGSYPPPHLLARASKNVIITGYVSDEVLRRYYTTCRLFVAPLRYGAGVNGKIIEGMYYGIPVITTSIGAEGISRKDALKIIDNENDFIENIKILYTDTKALYTLLKKSHNYITKHFSKSAAIQILSQDIDFSVKKSSSQGDEAL